MKILVVEPIATRRAELVDWTCELPGFVVVGAVRSGLEAEALLTSTRVDVVVIGAVSAWDLSSVTRASQQQGSSLVEARDSMAELAAALAAHRAFKIESTLRSVHHMWLEHEREARHASVQTLQYRLRNDAHAETSETIDLREWLPATIERLRAVLPSHIELVPMVAIDTLPVRCVARDLEDLVYERVLRAAAHLPWGGTVWLTAAPAKDGEVTLDVLENGRGEIHDVRLRASAPQH